MTKLLRKITGVAAAACVICMAFAGPAYAQNAAAPAGSPAAVSPAAASPAPDAAAAPAPPQQPDSTATAANGGTGIDLTWPVPAASDPKTSLTTGAPTIDDAGKTTIGANSELVKNVAHNKVSINIVWTLVTGFLVMFMQAGFALVETGLCRAKSAAHVMATNFMIYGLGMLGFWVCGFAFMFGNYANGPVNIGWQPSLGQGLMLLNHGWGLGELSSSGGYKYGLIGLKGFFLSPSVFDTAIFTLFLFEMVFMDTTATIPTGCMAERWDFRNFIIYGFWVGMFPYAIYGSWVWGGGWLAQSGVNWNFGHGAVDFAGSGVVHMCGGMIAIAGGLCIGPRLGKYGKDGKARAIPGHDIPMVMLGTFILAFGWFGFNPGSTLAGTDNRIAIIAVNTMLAGAAASVGTLLTMYVVTGKPDPSMLCNGLLAGLVAITAPCAFVNSAGAVLLGFIAGVIVVFSVFFFERVAKIDDAVGAISVHGICGAWGVLSVGLFANGSYGQGWGGVHKLFKDGQWMRIVNDGSKAVIDQYNTLIGTDPKTGGWTDIGVTGIFGKIFGAPEGDFSQFQAQLTDVCVCAVFVILFSLAWFKISNLIFPIRSKREDEIAGLDVPEMGVEAYPDFQITDKSSPAIE
ncbi:MAG TPA: ammonium transporter [Verrucomicrobiae bacterium]|nr:ammonium transporter [Verrucomicrobiae bacterium]